METSEALRIIESLAQGVDPLTGEVFPNDSPYQHPQTLRALFIAVRALERLEARQKREHRLPENAGKTWNSTEDYQLCASFDTGTTIQQLSQQHKRTEGAIHSRLVKLGKIPPPTQVSPSTPSL